MPNELDPDVIFVQLVGAWVFGAGVGTIVGAVIGLIVGG